MATIADMSGDEREQRAAELKRKMQEAAKKRAAQREQTAETAEAAPAADAEADTTAAAAAEPAPVAAAAATQRAETVATVEAAPVETSEPVAEPVTTTVETPTATNGSGSTTAAATAPTAVMTAPPPGIGSTPTVDEEAVDPEAAARAEMNRREFLIYTWGAALGLLTLQAGVASYFFLYPRFRAGEFGGDFFKTVSDFGAPTTAPAGDTTGKFWMVTTEDGNPKAIYMVCTHLGCLYKWVEANFRFECPCHGSKFSHDGFYIEGPAPRSLDYFDITLEGDTVVVHTGSKNIGSPSAESPARAVPA